MRPVRITPPIPNPATASAVADGTPSAAAGTPTITSWAARWRRSRLDSWRRAQAAAASVTLGDLVEVAGLGDSVEGRGLGDGRVGSSLLVAVTVSAGSGPAAFSPPVQATRNSARQPSATLADDRMGHLRRATPPEKALA